MKNYHIGCGYMAGKSWINYDSGPIAFLTEFLLEELKLSGFQNIRECEFGDTGLDVFKEVENKDRFEEENYNLKAIVFYCVK